MLEIDQEVSSINPSAAGSSDIITNKKTIKTTVMVENGQTIVLGGLIDNKVTKTKRKVPVLGSIPLLGKLFRYKKASKGKQNLMVFLRPVILSDPRTQNAVTNSKYRYMRKSQIEMNRSHKIRKGPLLNKDIKQITPIPPEVLLQRYRKQMQTKPQSSNEKTQNSDTKKESAPGGTRKETITHIPTAKTLVATPASKKKAKNRSNKTSNKTKSGSDSSEHNYNQ
jgi:DNA primase